MVCTRAQPQKSSESVATMILGRRFVAISGLNLLSAGRSDGRSYSRRRIGRTPTGFTVCCTLVDVETVLPARGAREKDWPLPAWRARSPHLRERSQRRTAQKTMPGIFVVATINRANSLFVLPRLHREGHFWCSQGRKRPAWMAGEAACALFGLEIVEEDEAAGTSPA